MSTVTESSLDRGAIGLGEVLFQSVTSMAPAGAVALSIAAGATYAGGALPLAVLLALIACLLGAVSIAHTLACGTHDSAAAQAQVPQNQNATGKGQAKIVYFARFGVDENMIKAALAAALARGGDYADVFFQHKVSSVMALIRERSNFVFAGREAAASEPRTSSRLVIW